MAVHLTRIYTRTGDAGTTALGDGSRVAKTDTRIEAYADVDEANAALLAHRRDLPGRTRASVPLVATTASNTGVRCGGGSMLAAR
jgi:cob(I)alamin adenosyltransferase